MGAQRRAAHGSRPLLRWHSENKPAMWGRSAGPATAASSPTVASTLDATSASPATAAGWDEPPSSPAQNRRPQHTLCQSPQRAGTPAGSTAPAGRMGWSSKTWRSPSLARTSAPLEAHTAPSPLLILHLSRAWRRGRRARPAAAAAASRTAAWPPAPSRWAPRTAAPAAAPRGSASPAGTRSLHMMDM